MFFMLSSQEFESGTDDADWTIEYRLISIDTRFHDNKRPRRPVTRVIQRYHSNGSHVGSSHVTWPIQPPGTGM